MSERAGDLAKRVLDEMAEQKFSLHEVGMVRDIVSSEIDAAEEAVSFFSRRAVGLLRYRPLFDFYRNVRPFSSVDSSEAAVGKVTEHFAQLSERINGPIGELLD